MYKTIRHGENSLQYTILPQHDDYKGVDGKQRPAKMGRKKKSLMAFIGLFFVCSIIAGAILVPLMISVEVMSSPSAWFYKPQKSNTSVTSVKALKINKNEKFKVEIDSNEILSFNQQQKHVYPTKHSTTVTYLPKSTELDLSTINQSGTNALLQKLINTTPSTTIKTSTRPTTTATEQQLIQKTSSTTTAGFTTDSTTTTALMPTKARSPSPSSTIVENATKPFAKPIISIQPELNTKAPLETLDDVQKHKSSRNWIKSHWPIVDPSTYFSWTAYESEDNVLLPAIFCSALVAVVVLILLCFIVRKRKCLSCSKKRHDFMVSLKICLNCRRFLHSGIIDWIRYIICHFCLCYVDPIL